jgi:2-haloacid dehalogenase
MTESLTRVHTLTFDIFGTVLDLTGSIVPKVEQFLGGKAAPIDAAEFWRQWRARQRIEQHQDTILMLGHSGYLETAHRGLLYTLRRYDIAHNAAETEQLMRVFENLDPFPDAVEGLRRLAGHYRLAALSNGNAALLEYLVEQRIGAPLDLAISVDAVGRFKPHPSVYRKAAEILGAEPGEILMVAAHSFDILGARACGFRGAYVNRYGLPYETSALQPDLTVRDFQELASHLLT